MDLWAAAIPTLIGGTLALAGAVSATMYQSRETRRARQEQFSREDRYRLHRDRLEAYHRLYLAIGGNRRALLNLAHEGRTEEAVKAARRAREEYWEGFTLVMLVGSPPIFDAANNFLRFIDSVCQGKASFDNNEWRTLLHAYLRSARADLSPNER